MAKLLRKSPDTVFDCVQSFVYEEFKKELEFQACEHTIAELKQKLTGFDATANGSARKNPIAIAEKFRNFAAATRADAIFETHQKRFEIMLESKNYDHVLEAFNRKNLSKRISTHFGQEDYPRSVLEFLGTGDGDSEALRSAFLLHLPTLDAAADSA